MENVINISREDMPEKMLRAKDVQSVFGIARSTVDNWARYGYLTRHKLGRNIFYKLSEVQALLRV